MLQLMAARIEEAQVETLRSWIDSLQVRRTELRESYDRHGTRHELFLLVHLRRQPLLVIVAEVENDEHAARSFLRSNLPIDLEFKALFQEMSPQEAEIELLYDSSIYTGLREPRGAT